MKKPPEEVNPPLKLPCVVSENQTELIAQAVPNGVPTIAEFTQKVPGNSI